MLTKLTPAVQAKECVWQPSVGYKGLLVLSKLWVLLPELTFQKLKLTEPLLAVLDQETAVVFTPFATSWLLTSR